MRELSIGVGLVCLRRLFSLNLSNVKLSYGMLLNEGGAAFSLFPRRTLSIEFLGDVVRDGGFVMEGSDGPSNSSSSIISSNLFLDECSIKAFYS